MIWYIALTEMEQISKAPGTMDAVTTGLSHCAVSSFEDNPVIPLAPELQRVHFGLFL